MGCGVAPGRRHDEKKKEEEQLLAKFTGSARPFNVIHKRFFLSVKPRRMRLQTANSVKPPGCRFGLRWQAERDTAFDVCNGKCGNYSSCERAVVAALAGAVHILQFRRSTRENVPSPRRTRRVRGFRRAASLRLGGRPAAELLFTNRHRVPNLQTELLSCRAAIDGDFQESA